ncbi:MAG: termination factor Rho [Hydrocarboniphaga sp.]|uniref:termination factor Rho n=1 Tax=Hydrocarboniphaga sp. TaxID=2033016 RepID=UPI00261171DB|nr:termination factor Rho [Hydrocarboniphaga sp.]MDB5969604.1 termination factor Rho [Hydrocarboniphaga sp.]
MPRGDKSAYTAAQKRKAEHIEDSYEARGTPKKEAQARAWATINKQTGGDEKSGSGKSTKKTAKEAARKDSARRAVATKQGRSPNRGPSAKRSASKK